MPRKYHKVFHSPTRKFIFEVYARHTLEFGIRIWPDEGSGGNEVLITKPDFGCTEWLDKK